MVSDFWLAAGSAAAVALAGWAIRSRVRPIRGQRGRRGKPFPIPCHRLQPVWSHNRAIALAFRKRIDNHTAAMKRWLAGGTLIVALHAIIAVRETVRFAFPRRFAFISLREIRRRFISRERHLEQLAEHAHFATLVFGITGRAVAFAGRCRYHGPAAVLGVERRCWRRLGGVLCNSTLDHELTHCQQELICGALTYECHAKSRVLWLIQYVFIELHAHLFGGPLVFLTGIAGIVVLIRSALFLSSILLAPWVETMVGRLM
jgi:hypothetical protein